MPAIRLIVYDPPQDGYHTALAIEAARAKLSDDPNAGEITARTIKACNETKRNRVGGDHKDDRNDSRRRLGRQRRRAARRSQYGHPA